jgi:hypothetical protein
VPVVTPVVVPALGALALGALAASAASRRPTATCTSYRYRRNQMFTRCDRH